MRQAGVLITLSILLLSSFTVRAAMARGQGAATQFTAVVVCETLVEGNGDVNLRGIAQSDDPRFSGISEVEITFVGQQIFIHATFYPYAFKGVWIAPGHTTNTPLAPAVHKGYGTGELAGQKIMLRALPNPDLIVENPPCDPSSFVPVDIIGTIIDLPNR